MSSTISTEERKTHPQAYPACSTDTRGLQLARSSGFYTLVKRIGDVVLALIGLIATLPLWVFIALAIRLSSPGPVFFRQERPGKDMVVFRILKFRTMVRNAEDRLAEVVDIEDTNDPLIRVEHDPRVTGVGHLLRVTSLDELPQLINVLTGEMSMVGPRPISRPIYDPRNEARLQVPPGITGLWQISGRKNGNTNYMLTKDIEYLQRRSVLFDCGILLRTVAAVIRADGAR